MIEVVLSVVLLILHGIAIVSVLLAERRQPSATLAWLLALILLPVVGLVSWLIIGRTRATRLARRNALVGLRLAEVLRRCDVHNKLRGGEGPVLEERTESLLLLGAGLTDTPGSGGNRAALLVDAAATYGAMQEAIAAATDHVHVEFYIIQPDEVGRRMRDILVERARSGIAVRVLCDAVGSMALPSDFWDPLTAAGGEAAYYRPVAKILQRWRRRDRIDFRNHRKIVVVDGCTGFTGGINVGREYLGLDPMMGRWRDTHVRIEGPAALMLQSTFVADWFAATETLLDEDRYFPSPDEDRDGRCIVQVVESGPDRHWSSIEHLYVQAMALARERIWITNPYFVPSPSVEQAMEGAALRGVDVRLLVPARGDSLIVTWAAGSYFRPVLEAGGRIFRYEEGFVHAKTMVVDDWVGTVGSANMDTRSFRLNYELNAFIFGAGFVDDLAAQFEKDLEGAREVDAEEERNVNVRRRIVRAAARLLSPLL